MLIRNNWLLILWVLKEKKRGKLSKPLFSEGDGRRRSVYISYCFWSSVGGTGFITLTKIRKEEKNDFGAHHLQLQRPIKGAYKGISSELRLQWQGRFRKFLRLFRYIPWFTIFTARENMNSQNKSRQYPIFSKCSHLV